MHNRLIFRYFRVRDHPKPGVLRGCLRANRSTLGRAAKAGRRRVGEPRRWLSWGKRVGGGPGKSGPHTTLRRDTEPIKAKSLIPCCREKRLASGHGARTPNRLRWAGREYQGDRENCG